MTIKKYTSIAALILLIGLFSACVATKVEKRKIQETTVGEGWANNSINAVIFRRNSITTFQDTQFTAYYDPEGYMVLAKRKLKDQDWETLRTPYTGNVADAHNTISIAVDGEGYLHVSWDHHGHPLRYAKGKAPLSLELGEKQAMTGQEEADVTYPEFHNLPNGDLIFIYRSGASGRGNLVMNRYSVKQKKWTQLHRNLIDGEGERNAYWQAYVDKRGAIHLSWVWRETWDVSTNHDMAYALSTNGGRTWMNSKGEPYELPITQATAEYAWRIGQNSGLINQTTMYVDEEGKPYIATYWNDRAGVPQYQLIYKEGREWKKQSTGFRKNPFELGGGGTKRIPLSRPQLIVDARGNQKSVYLLFRDAERNNKVSMAYASSLAEGNWEVKDLTETGVGQWEPTYDIELWKQQQMLHLFVQKVEQIDGEGVAEGKSTPVRILELK